MPNRVAQKVCWIGMVTVAATVVWKILLEPMPYRDPDALYYVWRDYGPIVDMKRGGVAGPERLASTRPSGSPN